MHHYCRITLKHVFLLLCRMPGLGMEQKLDESNKGHQLLKKMGWGGTGLGANAQGNNISMFDATKRFLGIMATLFFQESKLLLSQARSAIEQIFIEVLVFQILQTILLKVTGRTRPLHLLRG